MMKIVAIALFATALSASAASAAGGGGGAEPMPMDQFHRPAAIPSVLRRRAVIPSSADLPDQAIVRVSVVPSAGP